MEFDFTNIVGSIKVLRYEEGLPTIFLIDENHENLNDNITKNVKNAKKLVATSGVTIIGVESHFGGMTFGHYLESFYEAPASYQNEIGNPEFANQLILTDPNLVFGVESEGMARKIRCQQSTIGGPYYKKSADKQPLNEERSKHFIKTLFELRTRLAREGNLILNCGLNHNTHIENWINSGEIDDIAGTKVNYIRLNAIT